MIKTHMCVLRHADFCARYSHAEYTIYMYLYTYIQISYICRLDDDDADVRAEACRLLCAILSKVYPHTHIHTYICRLDDEDADVRAEACRLLCAILPKGESRGVRSVLAKTEDPSPKVRVACMM